jgi:hypothetical protein
MNPELVPLGNGAPGERLMRYAPPPGTVKIPGSHFDHALDRPGNRPFCNAPLKSRHF